MYYILHTGYYIFYRLQRLVKSRLIQEKMDSWHPATDELNHRQGKEFWNSFKRLTQIEKKAHQCPKITLEDGTKCNEPQAIADKFAKTLQLAHKTQEGPLFNKDHRKIVDKFVNN